MTTDAVTPLARIVLWCRGMKALTFTPLVGLLCSATVARADAAELPRGATEPNRCVGWAVAGSLVGLTVGINATLAGVRAAGEDVNDPAHSRRNGLLVAGGALGGVTLGPMAACRLDPEAYVVPMASTIMLGAAVGAVALSVPFALWARSRRPPRDSEEALSRGEGETGLTVLLGAAGTVLGVAGGYLLHKWAFPARRSSALAVTPTSLPGGGQGLALAGSF